MELLGSSQRLPLYLFSFDWAKFLLYFTLMKVFIQTSMKIKKNVMKKILDFNN